MMQSCVLCLFYWMNYAQGNTYGAGPTENQAPTGWREKTRADLVMIFFWEETKHFLAAEMCLAILHGPAPNHIYLMCMVWSTVGQCDVSYLCIMSVAHQLILLQKLSSVPNLLENIFISDISCLLTAHLLKSPGLSSGCVVFRSNGFNITLKVGLCSRPENARSEDTTQIKGK